MTDYRLVDPLGGTAFPGIVNPRLLMPDGPVGLAPTRSYRFHRIRFEFDDEPREAGVVQFSRPQAEFEIFYDAFTIPGSVTKSEGGTMWQFLYFQGRLRASFPAPINGVSILGHSAADAEVLAGREDQGLAPIRVGGIPQSQATRKVDILARQQTFVEISSIGTPFYLFKLDVF